MIKLNPNPTFIAPVQLTVLDQAEPVTVQMTFKHMASDQATAWLAANEGKKSDEALAEIVLDWSGVQDDEGQEIPYSPQMLGTLLRNYGAATGEIVVAWIKGLNESRLKN